MSRRDGVLGLACREPVMHTVRGATIENVSFEMGHKRD